MRSAAPDRWPGPLLQAAGLDSTVRRRSAGVVGDAGAQAPSGG